MFFYYIGNQINKIQTLFTNTNKEEQKAQSQELKQLDQETQMDNIQKDLKMMLQAELSTHNNISLQDIFHKFDLDKNATLNQIEFLNLVLAYNTEFAQLKQKINGLYAELTKKSNSKEVDINTLKNYISGGENDSQTIANMSGFFEIKAKYVNKHFIDEGFIPDKPSLGKQFKVVRGWKTLNEIYENNFTLFNNTGLLPKQGKLGNCYFVSPIASIYHNTGINHLKTLFQHHCQDMTCVKINIDGLWTAIWVDHYIPYKIKKNQEDKQQKTSPAFISDVERAVWPILLEKAWAKVFGAYDQISSGKAGTSFNALTGAPTNIFESADKDFQQDIEKCFAQKAFITATTCKRTKFQGDESPQQKTADGMMGNHAYQILLLQDGLDSHGKPIRLIKIRNPWGKCKWRQVSYIINYFQKRGDQANQLKEIEIDKDVQDLQDYSKVKEKGIFYIDFNHFRRFFNRAQVCYFREGYQLSTTRVDSNSGQISFFEIEPQQEGDFFLAVHQQNRRFYRKKNEVIYNQIMQHFTSLKAYEYGTSMIGIINDKNKIISRSKFQKQHEILKELWVNIILKKKKYILFTRVNYYQREKFYYNVTSYGPELLKLKPLGFDIMDVENLQRVKSTHQLLVQNKFGPENKKDQIIEQVWE